MDLKEYRRKISQNDQKHNVERRWLDERRSEVWLKDWSDEPEWIEETVTPEVLEQIELLVAEFKRRGGPEKLGWHTVN
jgi:hypothetical protein